MRRRSVCRARTECHAVLPADGTVMETSLPSLLRHEHTKVVHLLLSLSLLAVTAPGGGVVGVSASYSETQFLGLEALYNATGGEQWTSSTGWRDAALGVCEWFGVACDSSGENVTGLSLAGNGLAGNLSDAAELFQIVSLEDMDLSENELVGPVALGLGLMSNLEQLDLSRNGLSSFPASWGSEASSLQHLSLRSNNISGWVVYTTCTRHIYFVYRYIPCTPGYLSRTIPCAFVRTRTYICTNMYSPEIRYTYHTYVRKV